ncbi:uncharacterized protein LOC113323679 [Papaver somniferum]|uniref:uncharacterized protein LOC113323679 n=1 Tax=Papaver somniferum TaxID=3469 RepID=UPI000E6FD7B1|nr:uncharacterized protein LOC113323679 [Papaver somniferum]XP_026427800.1 uncharacterized protein LOC113323679 [Papaver somniferum]XP_026427801.1 uncharacterized protein LOC113323679 [Papaver somniferum]
MATKPSSILHKEPEMSPEEEEKERKINALWREKLIARKIRQRERTKAHFEAMGLETVSYDPKIADYDYLLLPPSELRHWRLIQKDSSHCSTTDPMKADKAREEEANGVESEV